MVTGTIGDLGFDTGYYITVSAFDYGRNFSPISEIKTITTSGNHPPVIECEIGDELIIHVHDRYTIPFYITDQDRHVVNVSFTKDADDIGSALTLLESVREGEYRIQVVGNTSPEGTYRATLTASDNYGLSATKTFSYTILPNQAPVLKQDFPNMIFRPGDTSREVDATDYIEDPDGEILNYDIDVSDQSIVHVNQASGSSKIYVTPLSSSGHAQINLTATDAGGKSISSSFSVLIRNEAEALMAYPNPVVKTLYVGTGEIPDNAQIVITSASGVVMYNSSAYCSAFTPAQIDMSSYAPGIYILSVTYGGSTYKTNIIKK